MATLLTARDLAKTYGPHTLFEGVALSINDGERLALIGPNGSGKSTLLKILAGLETPDSGEFARKKNLRLAYVAQDDLFAPDQTVLEAVVNSIEGEHDGAGLDPRTRAGMVLSKLDFDNHAQNVQTLSGGWRKRLSIACALATEPDVLMLDEPTNHLDLEGVLWLESFVKSQPNTAMIFITHDRMFLESAANRIVELSRAYPGGTFEVQGNYSEFVRRKNDFLDGQAAQQTALAGKVRRDTAWLLQGVQGRQTRNKSQVQDAAERRDELKQIANRNNAPKRTASIDFQATERKTNRLLSTHNLTKRMGDKLLFKGLDLELSPGMRLGLLGPNGSGKTTLLRILNGQLQPDAGSVKQAPDLRVVNFTQHRESLNLTQSLREALCPVGDVVEYRGKPMHVASWAKKFLFDPSKFPVSVGDLSGGERARVLMADLMLKPADVLILDEPTNDLDIPSLEALEQSLGEFPGAIVLVTHDRFMLDRLSTELLALDGQGGAKRFVSYQQYCNAQAQQAAASSQASAASAQSPAAAKPRTESKKLSFKLQRELDTMEKTILEAEGALETLHAKVADPKLIADHKAYAQACEELAAAQQLVDSLYERWAELEALSQPAS